MIKRLNRVGRTTLAGLIAFGATLGGITIAQALWSDNDNTIILPLPVGNVAFGVSTNVSSWPAPNENATTAPKGYPAVPLSSPLYIVIPGAVIAQIMDQTGPDPEWIIWPFTVYGRADGVFGMEYDLIQVGQSRRTLTVCEDDAGYEYACYENRVAHSLGNGGTASYQTLLGHSTLIVFPAALGRDCSNVPEVNRETTRNVHVLDAAGGLYPTAVEIVPSLRTQEDGYHPWCVALKFNHRPDTEYVADATVRGTGQSDDAIHVDFDQWRAWVAFPPIIPPVGTYGARGTAEGIGEDGSISRDHDENYFPIHPDPALEPDVLLRATPRAFRS